MKKQRKFKVVLTVLLAMVVGGALSYVIFDRDESEYSEVSAVIDSNASNSEKMIFLEKRYSDEVGRLEILLSHSDLCSPKYLNELSTLSISFDATVSGYEDMEEYLDYSMYPKLEEKKEDFVKLTESFDSLYKNIDDEDYEKALEDLDVIEELLSKTYNGVEKELAEME